jgi:hypothetical protein
MAPNSEKHNATPAGEISGEHGVPSADENSHLVTDDSTAAANDPVDEPIDEPVVDGTTTADDDDHYHHDHSYHFNDTYVTSSTERHFYFAPTRFTNFYHYFHDHYHFHHHVDKYYPATSVNRDSTGKDHARRDTSDASTNPVQQPNQNAANGQSLNAGTTDVHTGPMPQTNQQAASIQSHQDTRDSRGKEYGRRDTTDASTNPVQQPNQQAANGQSLNAGTTDVHTGPMPQTNQQRGTASAPTHASVNNTYYHYRYYHNHHHINHFNSHDIFLPRRVINGNSDPAHRIINGNPDPAQMPSDS